MILRRSIPDRSSHRRRLAFKIFRASLPIPSRVSFQTSWSQLRFCTIARFASMCTGLNGVMDFGICVYDRMYIHKFEPCGLRPHIPRQDTGGNQVDDLHGHTMQKSVQCTTQSKAYNVGAKHSSSSPGNYRSPQRAFCLAEKDDAGQLVVSMSCGKSKQSKTTDSKATQRTVKQSS